MHAVHAGYTVIAELELDGAEPASKLLSQFRANPERLPFTKSATTHFATGAVLAAQQYGEVELPATLMLATSFCGPASAHVDELVRVMGTGLRELFQHCVGFPDPSDCSDEELARFIREHRQADTFYSGMQHLTPEDVRRHDQLRTAIETYVDERQAAGGFTGEANDIRREIQTFVSAQPELAWAREEWRPPSDSWLALHWRTILLAAVLAPFLVALVIGSVVLVFVDSAPLGVVVASGWLALVLPLCLAVALVWGVRDAELDQRHVAGRQPDALARTIAATQNQPVINEMTIAGPIKEGSARPVVLRIALWIVARVAAGIPGLRPGITIPTVATARWIAIDGGRRLVFISNYTNASEPYVRDFIDVQGGAMRINLLFGFGRGYPRTAWIILDGALADPNGFIHVVTANQRPTELWYCPYRHLSIDNITINRQIREGLFATLTDEQARAWLQLL